MRFVQRLQTRWGVGPWGTLAILAAFALAGTTVVRLKGPVLGLILADDAPTWARWTTYLVVIFPLYQICLLTYGTLLGQYGFFRKKLGFVGRLFGISRRRAG